MPAYTHPHNLPAESPSTCSAPTLAFTSSPCPLTHSFAYLHRRARVRICPPLPYRNPTNLRFRSGHKVPSTILFLSHRCPHTTCTRTLTVGGVVIGNFSSRRSDAVWIPGKEGKAEEGCVICGESARGMYCSVCVRVWVAAEAKVKEFEREMRRGGEGKNVGQVRRVRVSARRVEQKTMEKLKMMLRETEKKRGIEGYVGEEGVFGMEVL